MKKCFTINCMRKEEDFIGYNYLLENNFYQGIEIFYPYNVSEEQKLFYTNEIRKIHKKFPNVEIVMHLPHGHKNSLTDEFCLESMQLMKNAILYTKEFDTKKLTLHLGSVKKEKDRSLYIDEIAIVLKELCDFAGEYGMNVMVENMPGNGELGFDPDELLAIFIKTDKENIKFILDTGHAYVSGRPLTEYVYKLKDYLYHMHFNDNDGGCDQHKRMHLGTIDFNELFKALSDVNYNELHCMEVIFKEYKELIDFAGDLELYQKYYDKE